jgi:hypothetical protein
MRRSARRSKVAPVKEPKDPTIMAASRASLFLTTALVLVRPTVIARTTMDTRLLRRSTGAAAVAGVFYRRCTTTCRSPGCYCTPRLSPIWRHVSELTLRALGSALLISGDDGRHQRGTLQTRRSAQERLLLGHLPLAAVAKMLGRLNYPDVRTARGTAVTLRLPVIQAVVRV